MRANGALVSGAGTFVARARFVEDLVVERLGDGVDQFVIPYCAKTPRT